VVLDLEKLDDRTMHALDRFVHDTLDPSARTRRLQANAAQRAQAAGMAQRAAQVRCHSTRKFRLCLCDLLFIHFICRFHLCS
jgi:hypothetical protein